MPRYEIRQKVEQTLVKIVDADSAFKALNLVEHTFKDKCYIVEDRQMPTQITITLIKETT